MNGHSRPTSPSGRHESFWLATTPTTDYEPLEGGLRVDTAVVGGGIAGVTTAAKLREADQSVALLERDRILGAVTGHTTAKLTSLHGLAYARIRQSFGDREARLYAEANEAAIDDVAATVEQRGIDCDFERAPAYTYVESREKKGQVRDETEAARRSGLAASYVESTTLPFDVAAAVAVEEQASFHPRAYLLELAQGVPGEDSHLFEETTVTGVSDGEPCEVETDRGTVRADNVVVASHFPVYDPALYFARLSPKRSYVLGVRLEEEPPEGMYYGVDGQYFSVRPLPADDGPMALFGGQNHRTGHGATRDRYRKLEQTVRRRFDVESVEYRWSTQDYVSPDGVPFVGELAPQTDNVYVATGFGGWGMTGGTVAGMLLRDLILGRANEWAKLYDPSRLKLRGSIRDLASHNAHAAKHLVAEHAKTRPAFDAADLAPGEGGIYDVNRETMAIHRDEDGELHAVSAICSHMGCVVEWNDAEQSWDCPCHGSRFDTDGAVLDTPAVEGLEQYALRSDEPSTGADEQ